VSSRRWITWAIYLICAALVLDGLGFVTWQVLRLEKREAQAAIESERQEYERLALYRMDLFLAPLIAQESSRPYFHYLAFYPAERAYTKMLEQVQPGDVLVPSPLLTSARTTIGSGELIRLYFQIDPAGNFSSPQVPTGNMLDLAESRFGLAGRIQSNERLLERLQTLFEQAARFADATSQPTDERSSKQASDQVASRKAGDTEFERRARTFEQANPGSGSAQSGGASGDAIGRLARDVLEGVSRQGISHAAFGNESSIRVGGFRPTWVRPGADADPELMFIRQVTIDGQVFRQGIWIDWPMLRTLLIAGVRDLLPEASWEPDIGSGDTSRVLASLPVRLDPGPMPEVADLGWTWVRATLGVTWFAVVAAVAAIGYVLRASVRLSERRGRFVSAVTHELRTPLTTFCMYTEMLADGMVPDEKARESYLKTLKSESRRLAGIVENVLAYARLGRPRPAHDKATTVRELMNHAGEVLERRAEQAEAELIVSVAPEAESARVRSDAETIERVLFNLVDNACKYGHTGEEPARIHLDIGLERGHVCFRVRDEGPGVPSGERERIFGAFQRGASHGSHAEAGLGLGLALARGLARELGGDLVLEPSERGACFRLSLKTVLKVL